MAISSVEHFVSQIMTLVLLLPFRSFSYLINIWFALGFMLLSWEYFFGCWLIPLMVPTPRTLRNMRGIGEGWSRRAPSLFIMSPWIQGRRFKNISSHYDFILPPTPPFYAYFFIIISWQPCSHKPFKWIWLPAWYVWQLVWRTAAVTAEDSLTWLSLIGL